METQYLEENQNPAITPNSNIEEQNQIQSINYFTDDFQIAAPSITNIIEQYQNENLLAVIEDRLQAEQLEETLRVFEDLNIRNERVQNLINEARDQIEFGVERGDQAMVNDGIDTLESLARYARAEQAIVSFTDWFESQYPQEVGRFEFDYSSENASLEAAFNTMGEVEREQYLSRMQALDIVAVYQRLQNSNNPDAREIAELANQAREFILTAAPYFTGRPMDVGELEGLIEELEGIFLDPRLSEFQREVMQPSAERIEQSFGYQVRSRITRSAQVLAELSSAVALINDGIDAEEAEALRDAVTQTSLLSNYRARLASVDELDRQSVQ